MAQRTTKKIKKLICEMIDADGRLEQTGEQTKVDGTHYEVPTETEEFKKFMMAQFDWDVHHACTNGYSLFFRAGKQGVLVTNQEM